MQVTRRFSGPVGQASVAQFYPGILLHIGENLEGVLADDLRKERMDIPSA
jgi:hypothetical protein